MADTRADEPNDPEFIAIAPLEPAEDVPDAVLTEQLLSFGGILFPELQHWRDDSQKRYVVSAERGHNILAQLPTGHGKSVLDIVPALARGGLTLFVAPTLSFVDDLYAKCVSRQILAFRLTGQSQYDDQALCGEAVVHCQGGVVLTTPEKACSGQMQLLLEKVHFTQVVIDEAHCWVADGEWRSGYMRLTGWLGPFIKKKMMSVTFMSATLPGDFLSRASEELDVPRESWTVLMSSVSRPCLRLEVESKVRVTGAAKRIAELLQATPEAQCAVVFCRLPSQCDSVCKSLRKLGSVAARAGNRLCNVYYSALPMETRRRRMRKWLSREVGCLIGTTSNAMGIDHPSIGLVVHYGLPDSATSYAQHVGRAARRAGQTARCVLMCSPLADMSGWATLSSLPRPGEPASGAAAVDIGGRAEPDDASIRRAAWAEIEFVRQDTEDRRRFYRGLAAMALMARRAQLGACLRRLLGLAFVRYEDWDAEGDCGDCVACTGAVGSRRSKSRGATVFAFAVVAAVGCFKSRGIGVQEGYELVNAFFCNGSFEGAPQAVVKLIRCASEEEGLDAEALREDLHASLSSILLDPATKPASMITRAQFEFMCLYVVAESNCLSIIAVKSATRFRTILRLVAVPGSSGFSGSVVVGREVRRPTRP